MKSRKKVWMVGVVAVCVVGAFFVAGKYYEQLPLEHTGQKAALNDKMDRRADAEKNLPTQEQAASMETGAAESSLPVEDGSQDGEGSRGMEEVLALRDVHTAESIQKLGQLLNDSHSVVVSEAIDALGHIALQKEELKEAAYNILASRAREKGFSRRDQALVTAATLGKERILPLVADILEEGKTSADPKLTDMAVRALNIMGSLEGTPLLMEVLDSSKDPNVRRNSMEALVKIGSREALERVSREISSAEKGIQQAAVMALGRLDNPEINASLVEMWKEGALQNDTLSLVITSASGPSVVGGMLQDASVDEEKRTEVIRNLAEYGVFAGKEVRVQMGELIQPLLQTGNPVVEIECIRALGRMGTPENYEAIVPKLYVDNPQVRQEALTALAGYVNPQNYQMFLELLWDQDEMTRRTAMFLAGRFLREEDHDVLVRAAEHGDGYISRQAREILNKMP